MVSSEVRIDFTAESDTYSEMHWKAIMIRLSGVADSPLMFCPSPIFSLCIQSSVASCGILPTRFVSRWRLGKSFSSTDPFSVVSPSADEEEPCALSESEGDSDKARSNRRRKSSCLVGRETFLIPAMFVLEKVQWISKTVYPPDTHV